MRGVQLHLFAGIDVNGAISDVPASVGQPSDDGATSLFLASLEGHLEVVQVLLALLAAQAHVDQAMSSGETPLYAASHNRHLEVVQMLVAGLPEPAWTLLL